ncbi:hypothetical protein OESDEN_20375, partial [Oesophagostomum dentatum]
LQINVWTHFVPAVCLIFFYIIPEIHSPTPRLPVLVLYTGVGVLLLGSTLAHLLHSRSPHDHIFWFLVDFSGIAMFGCSIGLQRFSCSTDLDTFVRLVNLYSCYNVCIREPLIRTCILLMR